MDTSVQVELVKQGASLLISLLWPLTAILVIFRFKDGISRFFSRISELNIKTAAGEFSAKAAAEVGAALGAAQTARRAEEGGGEAVDTAADVRAVTQSVEAVVRASPRLQSKSILWVDDYPTNNQYEMKAFEALGIRVDIAKSTEDAMPLLSSRRYDLVITDLTRGKDSSAGLKFIERAKSADRSLRILVYSSRRGEHQYPEAYRLGAVGATYRPNELFDRAISLLGG